MDCREARELLSDELDGRLDAAASRRLAEHVAGCPACDEEREELERLRASFRAMPRPAAPAGFRQGVMAALPKGRVLAFPRALGWLAVAAAAGFLAFTILPRDRGTSDTEVATAARSERVREDERLAGALADSDAAPPAGASAPVTAPAAGPAPQREAAADPAELDKRPAGDAPAAEKPAAEKPAEKAAGTAKKDAAASGEAADDLRAEAKKTLARRKEEASTAAEDLRYVVFRDAAAAESFLASLVSATKDKAPAPGFSGPATPGDEARGRGARAKAEDAAKSDVVKEASFTARRVVGSVGVAIDDASLAERIAEAGATLVPQPDAGRFAELLDTDGFERGVAGAPAPDPPAEPPAGGGTSGAGATRSGAEEASRRRDAAAARVLRVVVVVLEAPPRPK